MSILAIIIISLSVIFLHDGWPYNHEVLRFMIRTKIYAEHFRHWDLFPIWSSGDSFGMGSPLPLYYQKLFYYFAAPVYIITANIKFSILFTIGLFMMVGAYGMRFATRTLTDGKLLLVAAPMALILSNYTFTEWITRGAMSEFAAMMIVPWLIWWCLNLIIYGEFSYGIVAILYFTLVAHNVVALFAVIPLTVSFAIYLHKYRLNSLRLIKKNVVISFFGLTMLAAPLLIFQKLFLKSYDPSRITELNYTPVKQFRDFIEYISSTDASFSKITTTLNIQIDYGVWIPLLIILVFAGYMLLVSDKKMTRFRRYFGSRVMLFLTSSLAIFFLLQLRLSTPIYENFRIIQFVQFPWRLLVFIVPLGILIIVNMVARFAGAKYFKYFVGFWILTFLILSPILKSFDKNYPFYDSSLYVKSVKNFESQEGRIVGLGEYLPRVTIQGKSLTAVQTFIYYSDISRSGSSYRTVSGGPCTYQMADRAYESLKIRLIIDCLEPAVVALPISYNDYTTIHDATHDKTVEYKRTDMTDPRIMVPIEKPGRTTLEIKLPTWQQVIF